MSTPSSFSSLPDKIANLAIETHASLPSKYKPITRCNGVREWTILAAIVLVYPNHADDGACSTHAQPDLQLKLVSLGTGMKCLPYNRLPPMGDTLHDQHAEVLARRGFRRWLVDKAREMFAADRDGHEGGGGLVELSKDGRVKLREGVRADGNGHERGDNLVELSKDGRIKLRGGVKVYLYVSTLPCGSASSTCTTVHQPLSMAALKSQSQSQCQSQSQSSSQPPSQSHSNSPTPPAHSIPISRGRNNYTLLSTLRTKPGRPDSFPSISMSCSDKIASWSVLGLQGALLAPIFEPVYLDGVVVGDVGRPPGVGEAGLVGWGARRELGGGEGGYEGVIRREAEWALWGRLEGLKDLLPQPYRLAKPPVHLTSIPFPYSKPSPVLSSTSSSTLKSTPSPPPPPPVFAPMINALLHLPHSRTTEQLYQGCDARVVWKAPGARAVRRDRRSKGCKLEMMRSVLELERVMGVDRDVEVEVEAERERGWEKEREMEGKGTRMVEAAVTSGEVKKRHEYLDSAVDTPLSGKGDGDEQSQFQSNTGTRPRSLWTYWQLKHYPQVHRTLAAPERNDKIHHDGDCVYGGNRATDSSATSYPSPSPSPSLSGSVHLDETPRYQHVKALLRGTPGVEGIVPGFEKCGLLSVTGWSSEVARVCGEGAEGVSHGVANEDEEDDGSRDVNQLDSLVDLDLKLHRSDGATSNREHVDTQRRAGTGNGGNGNTPSPPFVGWLCTGREWEDFRIPEEEW